MDLKKVLQALAAIIGCQAVGIAGAIFTTTNWLDTLNQPFFQPPGWVFAPVWTLLYAMMGLAAYLVWSNGWEKPEVRKGIYLFAGQLLLNGIWSPIFFGMKSLVWGLVDIVLLWIMIVLTINQFKKVSEKAFWLMIPYLAWVSFAAVLNLALLLLN